ncbi:2-c-methyl-d-erythritol cyclodiphosphate synthase [Nannochloropsis oceanica]
MLSPPASSQLLLLACCLVSCTTAFLRPATTALSTRLLLLQGRGIGSKGVSGSESKMTTTTTITAVGRSKGTTTALSSAYSEPTPLASDPPFRIGHGFDIHRLEPGLPLVIGGVKIDFEKGSAAHSDGDALYHSVTDAILGAIGMPDIGQLFPDNDPKWKGANSSAFLKEAHRLMTLRGYKIGNVDVTLILQKPKVMGIKPQMKENVVSLLQTTPDRVNIKARTHENVDSVGESRSWVVHVVILLEKV